METSECDFYEKPYRRVPVNSATTQREYIDHNSTVTVSTYNMWPGPLKRTLTTTYIDGATVLSESDRSLSMKDLFPKGKNRHKSVPPTSEKRMVIFQHYAKSIFNSIFLYIFVCNNI